MSMEADTAHRFWLGQVNVTVALARGQMKAKGPVAKILKLVPLVKPVFPRYKAQLEARALGPDRVLERSGRDRGRPSRSPDERFKDFYQFARADAGGRRTGADRERGLRVRQGGRGSGSSWSPTR